MQSQSPSAVHVVVPTDTSRGLYVFADLSQAETFAELNGWAVFTEEPVADHAAGAEHIAEELRERGTCSACLARTYRGEECVCDDGEGDAEDVRDQFDAITHAEPGRDPLAPIGYTVTLPDGRRGVVQRVDELAHNGEDAWTVSVDHGPTFTVPASQCEISRA